MCSVCVWGSGFQHAFGGDGGTLILVFKKTTCVENLVGAIRVRPSNGTQNAGG